MEERNFAYAQPAEPLRQPRQEPVRAPGRRPAILPEARPRKAPKARVNILYIALIAVCAVAIGSVISIYSRLTELSVAAYGLKTDIAEMEKERTTLNYELSKQMNKQEMENYAVEKFGMVKATNEDVRFLSHGAEDSFEVMESSGEADNSIIAMLWNAAKSAADYVWNFVN